MESRHIKILNNMASVGGSVDSVISSDTMSSVSLCENDIPGSSLDGRVLSVLKCLALVLSPRFSARPPCMGSDFLISLICGELG